MRRKILPKVAPRQPEIAFSTSGCAGTLSGMEKSVKAAFSARLIQAMRACPHASKEGTKHGIDTAALKAAARVSMEMARRYVEAQAIPRPEVMKTIAEWLNVRIGWLRDGEGPMRLEPGDLPVNASRIGEHRSGYGSGSRSRGKLEELIEAVERGEISEDQLDAALVLLLGPARGRDH